MGIKQEDKPHTGDKRTRFSLSISLSPVLMNPSSSPPGGGGGGGGGERLFNNANNILKYTPGICSHFQ